MAQMQLAIPWHDGELAIRERLPNSELDNPTNPRLSPQAAVSLQSVPLLAVGALDEDGRPWSSLWGGETGFGRPLGQGMIAIKLNVDKRYDPVVKALLPNSDGMLFKPDTPRMMSALTTNLEQRKRQKLFGRMIAGAVVPGEDPEGPIGVAQIVVAIEQSLGNCPKYLNCKSIEPHDSKPTLHNEGATLDGQSRLLIANSDLFYISSAHKDVDMDTNHRGGPTGFVRTTVDSSGAHQIIWPEYSGNRLYQTLGNLQSTPKAGVVFPDFVSGNVLYATGDTEILIGADAAAVIPRSNLAVRLTVVKSRFVSQGLTFRGEPGEMSPYNPRVRPLAHESNVDTSQAQTTGNTAKLLSKEEITPTITRFRFTLSNPTTWKAGAWAAFDFSDDLDMGYSHMRDDDPSSLNEDWVRTFTVSSPPAPREKNSDDEFEITIRRVGRVTGHMFSLDQGSEVAVMGFGGGIDVEQKKGEVTPFVAGGIGITPLLAVLPELDLTKLKLFWTLHSDDVDMVTELLAKWPALKESMSVFVTGKELNTENQLEKLSKTGVKYEARRLQKGDLAGEGLSNTWYTCVSTKLQPTILNWLEGKEVIFENFNF